MTSPTGEPSRPAGLEPGQRYRCAHCGNLTRFDVVTSERVRRFWHLDLGGAGAVERAEPLEVAVDAVECHWCATGAGVEVVDVPAAGA